MKYLALLVAFLFIGSAVYAQSWQPYTEAGNNVTGFFSAFVFVNSETSGLFGVLLSFSIFIVAFITLRSREEFSDALMAASFIAFVLSVFLKILNLTGDWVVGLFAFIMVVSVILSAKNWIR